MPRNLRRATIGLSLWLLALAVNRSLRRVTGRSMLPALAPGDVVLTVPSRLRTARPGDVVVVGDPRAPTRRSIKRAVAWTDAGLEVRGDNPAASTDSRSYGPVPAELVLATVPVRLGWPPRRLQARSGRRQTTSSSGSSSPRSSLE